MNDRSQIDTRTGGSAATPMAEGGALVRPPTDETSEEYAEGFLAGAAGAEIYWRAWLPSGAPRAVVVIAHGIGEHSGRYAHVAGRFTVASFATYALDHRGHGQSSGPRALVDPMDHAVTDVDMSWTSPLHPGAFGPWCADRLAGVVELIDEVVGGHRGG
jgi:pimeloyl-ACP methyl ester carboxylesterase